MDLWADAWMIISMKAVKGGKKGDRKGKGKGKDKSGKLNWPSMNFFAVYNYAPKRKLPKALSDAAASGTRLCFKFQEGKCKASSCRYRHACALCGCETGYDACSCDKSVLA